MIPITYARTPNGPDRKGVLTAAAILATLALAGAASAGQQGGSIYYEDKGAAEAALAFRVHTWHDPDGYSRYRIEYRKRPRRAWRALDSGWGWNRRDARRKAIAAARYIARDGYLWRYERPRPAPALAKRARFGERCFARSVRHCERRLR